MPGQSGEAELSVRGSRFVAYAAPSSARAEAMAAVAQRREAHPKARHHCWAYLVGPPTAARDAGSSDDGEPSGTAGQPILGLIQRQAIGDAVVVVSRYFGGVKLGAGGLARTYARAAGEVLAGLPLARCVPRYTVELRLGFALEHAVRDWAAHHDAWLQDVAYDDGVTLRVSVPEVERQALAAFCSAQGIAHGFDE